MPGESDHAAPLTPERMLERLNGNVLGQGFSGWLGIIPLRAEVGLIEFATQLRPEMTQHHGFAHGGIVGAMADNACAWAGALAAQCDVVTSSYSVHFLAPAKGERLRAVGRAIRAGKRVVTAEAQVYAESDGAEPKLVATALASVAVLGPAL